MQKSAETEIAEAEKRLRQAMLQSDLNALDELLAPDLIFTNHLGQIMTKNDDLEAHRTGILTISEIELSDYVIRFKNDVAIVSVKAHILGAYAGMESESDFRFTRFWGKSPDDVWQVMAGHSSIVT